VSARERRIAELRAAIGEVDPTAARSAQEAGAVLIDVREADEVAEGSPAGALRLTRGFLELRVEDAVPDRSRALYLICAGGTRSLFAAQGLVDLGYQNVRSVSGGYQRWKALGLPSERPLDFGAELRRRYARHLTLPEVGETGQRKLLGARVLIVGAGGLGSPAAFYLAAAGVGTLRIVDDDVVDRSNLQRQILHTDGRVGRPKVESARETLLALNPSLRVEAIPERLRADNVERLLEGCDVVLDGTDNFAARYVVNDACARLGIPNVHGAIYRFEGQLSVFWPVEPAASRHPGYPAKRGPCYRCLYPEAPPAELAPSCAEAGVLGVLPGVIGTLEAVEAIKILLGIGRPLVGRLLVYDALEQTFQELEIDADPHCAWCAPGAIRPALEDSNLSCTAPVR